MQILYTGATKQGAEQLDAGLSLGGFVSGSDIPNDVLSNIFSVASTLAVQNKRREAKMIALKNNDGMLLTNINIVFTLDADSICKYKIAFVSPTVVVSDSCFEKIANTNALPYYATFQNIVNGGTFNIATLLNNAYLGIWLIREYDYDSDELKKKTCVDWAITPQPTVSIKENLAFSIEYTIGDPSVSIVI